MKKKLAALLLSFGMVTNLAMPLFAYPLEGYSLRMAEETESTDDVGFLVPVEQKTEVPEGYIGIYTAEDLDNVRNDLDANYILMNDIDLSAYENWVPIGLADGGNSMSSSSFRGTFDGNGFCISNLSFKHKDDDNPTAKTDYLGLFYRVGGYDTYSTIIRNIYISNVYFDYDGSEKEIIIGVLASGAYNNSRIDNCIVAGDIVVNMKNNTSNAYIGGVIGVGYNCSICQCSNMVDINFSRKNDSDYGVYIGGIAGNIITWGEESVSALICLCTNNGSISASAHSATLGGIVGSSHNQNGLINIFDCSNLASINLSYPDITTALNSNRLYGIVGGIVGENTHSASGRTYIAYSFNNAEITVKKEDLESVDYECTVECGGIIGNCSYDNNSSEAMTSIDMCYNSGDIHISGMHTMRCGGIIGYLPLHDGCNSPYADCKISYNTGNIECSEANTRSSVGSIIGEYYNKGGSISLYKCYYNDFGINGIGGEVSDTQLSDCIALSDTEMQSASSFVGFDFDTVWEIGVTEGYPYPTLRNNPHNGNYTPSVTYPAPKLTVIPGTSTVQTEFELDTSLCTEAIEFVLETYDIDLGMSSLVETNATGADIITMPQTPGTYSACLYAIYEDGTKVASNTVTYTVEQTEGEEKPIISGLKNWYTIALGDSLTLDGTLTAAGDGMLYEVELKQWFSDFAPRHIELNGLTNTFNLADFGVISTDESPLNAVGVYEFAILAVADNYNPTSNVVGGFVIEVVEPSAITTISTTFDTTAVTLAEGETFDFAGIVSTTAEDGLEAVQIDIHKYGDDTVGITHFRKSITDEKDPLNGNTFDLSAIPSFTCGDTLTGQTDNTITLSAGTSWNVYLYAKDTDGNTLGGSVIKRIDIVEAAENENPLVGNKYVQTTNIDSFYGIPYIEFNDETTGEFMWVNPETGESGTDDFTYYVSGDTVTLIAGAFYLGNVADEIVLDIVDETCLEVAEIINYSTTDELTIGCTGVGDTFEMEIEQVKPEVEGLQKNYTLTEGEDLSLNFTVTAGGENGLLKAVTLKEPDTNTVFERKPKEGQPDLNEPSVTFNTTIPDLSVGEHNLVVYATANNYNGDPTNEIFEFTVTVKKNAVISGKWELSEQGKKLLKNLEGGVQKDGLHLLYDDDHDYSDGWENPTIGHGTLVSDTLLAELSDGKYTSKSQLPTGGKYTSGSNSEIEFLESNIRVSITDDEAFELFENKLPKYENAANTYLEEYDIVVTQNEYDAIAMFVYNLGENYLDQAEKGDYRIVKVLKGIRGPNNEPIDEVTVKEAFTTNCDNPPLKGLIKRRLCEAYVYLYGYVDGKTNPESYYNTEDYDYYWYVRQNRDNPDINPSIYLNSKIEGDIEQPDETQEYIVSINNSVITSNKYENPNNSKLVITVNGVSKNANYSSLQLINLSTEEKLEIECDEINNGIAKYSVAPKKIEQGLYKLSFYSGKNEKIYDSAVLINSFEITHYEINKTNYNVWYDFCNDERDEYINEKINEWLEDERIIDALENDKYATFFFEGAGNELDTSTRMAALCVVFHYNNGEIAIAFEDRNSTTIPDQPRYPNTNKGTDVPICRDGIYIVKTTNHPCTQKEIIDGKETTVNYPYAALKVSCTSDGDVLRTNGTTHYENWSGGINIHARSQNYIAGKNADWANSAGCFNVGLNEVDKNGLSSGFTKYNEFIEVFTGVENARTLNKKNNKTTKAGVEVGYVVVDRTLYEAELNNIYGNDNTSSSKETVKLILNEE